MTDGNERIYIQRFYLYAREDNVSYKKVEYERKNCVSKKQFNKLNDIINSYPRTVKNIY